MKFDELDRHMRRFETSHDLCVLPGIHMVARIDGRNFTRLTKELHEFDRPFDQRFRDHMVDTARHLMECGFNVVYAHTQSDEISLLFARDETSFGRKLRKLNSVLAGEASAKFSLALGAHGTLDCRICQLPDRSHVVDYFRWRHEDAHRNALHGHCYWLLRDEGMSARQATAFLEGNSSGDKNELLFERGINFNDLPSWQKRGVGLYWETYEKEGTNLETGQKVKTLRRRIKTDFDLPMKDSYSAFVASLLDN